MFMLRSILRSSATGWLVLGSAAVSLSACAGLAPHEDRLAGSVRACLAENVGFLDGWGCIQARYTVGQISEADPGIKGFLKLGDDLAQRVAAKKLTDAKARQLLSAGLPSETGR